MAEKSIIDPMSFENLREILPFANRTYHTSEGDYTTLQMEAVTVPELLEFGERHHRGDACYPPEMLDMISQIAHFKIGYWVGNFYDAKHDSFYEDKGTDMSSEESNFMRFLLKITKDQPELVTERGFNLPEIYRLFKCPPAEDLKSAIRDKLLEQHNAGKEMDIVTATVDAVKDLAEKQ